MVGARNLVRCLIPVDAGVAFPEQSERRLVLSARRSGLATERLDGVEIVRVRVRWSDLAVVQAANWVLLTRTNIVVNANPWALIAPNAGGVGRHWPTAVPPVNGG